MNRPKFRVWDKKEQKWYKPTYKAYMNELHDIHIDLDGRLLIRTIDESGKRVTIHESMFEGRYELLQSTGLFDKNGKEIFEGDIIDKGYSNLDIVDRIGYVKFGTGYDSDGYLNQEWLGWITNNDDSLLDVHEQCTVLGNKFEHQHLLGEE
ncbi:YopX family protein [Mammaliicoccus sciuri]|uniref:YopX family protein n=1 Tax=Mammaliicoccus sciuri TaxID=1296 RepID=UPI001FB5506E|nr:YopX family protein [Mammaliicoccus sciuri]MCJ1765844.1 YopX family protein [Mammaliicoccus sciuri]MCJ1774674.1 YopX family protein [Mammaliicoccus sciuri]